MPDDIRDITIIGGGPTGLFALFYAGMRGVSAQIVDALPQLGGQLTALYPEKFIFDVGGFAKILAKDLVKELVEQASQFNLTPHLNQNVVALEQYLYGVVPDEMPPDWPMGQEAWQEDESSFWPVQWLKMMARMPHEYETWLWTGHTVPNQDPPRPYGRGTSSSARS